MTLIRSLLFNLFYFGITALILPYGLALRWFAPHRILPYARFWARMILAGARVICGIRVAITGREHLPSGPALIASRHESAFDTMIWLTLLPAPAYVLKTELLRIPLFGPLLRPAGMIPVDRAGAGPALRGLMRDGAAAARAGRQIVIFPEGTRADPGTILPLHPGIAALASATGLPVIPVATDSGDLWGRRSFNKRAGTIRVAILPPLAPGLPRAALMAGLEGALANGMRQLRPGLG